MSEYEVVREYRQAKYPDQQITILAQLNGVPRADIIRILRKKGLSLPARQGRGRTALVGSRRRRAEELFSQGLNDREIAERVSVSRGAVSYWRRVSGRKKERPRAACYDWERAYRLWGEGRSDSEIARELGGACRQTVSAWRARRGLAANGRRGGG